MKLIIFFIFFVCSVFNMHAQQNQIHLGLEQGMRNGRVLSMAQDAQGRVWLATEGGLHCWDGYRFTVFDTDNSPLTSNELNVVLVDSDGWSIWIGTQRDGLCKFDTRTGKWFVWHEKDGLLADCITHLKADKNGGIWITYYLRGVDHRAKDGTLTHYSAREMPGLEGENWKSMYDEETGKLYIGHVRNGLSVIDTHRHTLSTYRRANLPISQSPKQQISQTTDYEVNAIAKGPDGRIWLGTAGGIDTFDPKTQKIEHHNIVNDNVSNLIFLADGSLRYGLTNSTNALMEDRQGNLWLSDGRRGVTICTHEKRLFELIDSMPQREQITGTDRVQDICHDGSTMWVATTKGLWRTSADGARQKMENINRQLEVLNINSLAVDKLGRLWLGTFGEGLYVFEKDGRQIAHVRDVPSVTINMVRRDSKGRMWVATRHGLSRFDDMDDLKRFHIYGRKEGLQDAFLRSIIEDANGRIWMSSNTGISCLFPASDSILNYSHADGIPYGEFVKGQVCQMTDGHIVFGQEQGACIFLPDDVLKASSTLDNFFISAFHLIRHNTDTGAEEALLQPLAEDQTLHFNHDENSFRIQIGSSDASQAGRTEFMYQIDGLDDSWFAVAESRELILHSLPPGNYTLRLKARLRNGIWSETQNMLNIHISQPWWWTWWARFIYLLLIAAFVWFEWHRYQQQQKMRRRMNERLTVMYAVNEPMPAVSEEETKQKEEETRSEELTEDKASPDPVISNLDREFLERLDTLILQNIHTADIDIQFLTDHLAMSHSTLYRRIKSLTGMTANEYVRRHRLARAMQMLREGYNVTEVAFQCGFSSPGYFRRCFKAEYGALPSDIR